MYRPIIIDNQVTNNRSDIILNKTDNKMLDIVFPNNSKFLDKHQEKQAIVSI